MLANGKRKFLATKRMTALEYTALGISTLIFMIGLVGSLVPVVPGSLIVWSGVLVHRLWMGEAASISWKIVILTFGLMLIGQVADFFLGVLGAKWFGASWKGTLGAFLGAIIALFIPPQIITLMIGPTVGAVIGELAAGRNFKECGKAGVGTVVGGVLAFALKIGISTCVISLFFFDLFLV